MPRCCRECGCYEGVAKGSKMRDHPGITTSDRRTLSKPAARQGACKPESASICEVCYRDLVRASKAVQAPADGSRPAPAQYQDHHDPPATTPLLDSQIILTTESEPVQSDSREELAVLQPEEGSLPPQVLRVSSRKRHASGQENAQPHAQQSIKTRLDRMAPGKSSLPCCMAKHHAAAINPQSSNLHAILQKSKAS